MTEAINHRASSHKTNDKGCDFCGKPWSEAVRQAMDGRRMAPVCEGCAAGLRNFTALADMGGEAFYD